MHEAPCIDCGEPTQVADLDETAICDGCLDAARFSATQPSDAGATWVGRQRGTVGGSAPLGEGRMPLADQLRSLQGKFPRLKGRIVRVGPEADYAIGRIAQNKVRDGRIQVEIVDPRDSGWPLGYTACFLPEDLSAHVPEDDDAG